MGTGSFNLGVDTEMILKEAAAQNFVFDFEDDP